MIQVRSFASYEDQQQLDAHQRCLIRVVLEGPDDVALFRDSWFVDFTEVFEFVSASSLTQQSGCEAVPGAVRKSVEHDGVPAIGVLDRDVLFKDRRWSEMYELDRAVFTQKTLDDRIHTAWLWEIEAYLLDHDLLEFLVESCHRSPPCTPQQRALAVPKAVEECEFLLDNAPILAALHSKGEGVTTGYMWDQSLNTIGQDLSRKAAAFDSESRVVQQNVQQLIDAVKGARPDTSADRLLFSLRYVDTKRLLRRLTHILGLKDSRDCRWTLSALQRSRNRRPEEFESMLIKARERYAVY